MSVFFHAWVNMLEQFRHKVCARESADARDFVQAARDFQLIVWWCPKFSSHINIKGNVQIDGLAVRMKGSLKGVDDLPTQVQR